MESHFPSTSSVTVQRRTLRNQVYMQHYLRTTRWLNTNVVTLPVGSNCRVRRWAGPDTELFREEVRKRNVFARHAGLGDFYYQRATALQDATVVEIFGGG